MITAACSGDPSEATSEDTETTGSTGETATTTAGSTTSDTTTEGPTTGPDEDDPLLEGAPTPDTPPGEQAVDVFGDLGLRYWFAVQPEQVARMNEKEMNGDIYVPGGARTYADHLFVTSTGASPTTADYGKVEVRLVGESTFRPWTPSSIPSIKVDTDEFTEDLEISGVEHIRFHNSLVGSIFREKIALEIYARLGYPAPRATYAWVGSNVWGPEVEVPYTVVENYKKAFCKRQGDAWGGGCENMWEFVGDLDFDPFEPAAHCQLSSCDPTRANQFKDQVLMTPPGPGFKAALAGWLDWDAFHRFQCISWLLWTGDDALHNRNNVVIVERSDGLFQYLPYSVDISAGQEWYQDTPLYGINTVAFGCQGDPACWADTIAACEDTIAEFVALDPPALVDEVHAQLAEQGMLRDGDDGRYEEIRAWYEARVDEALPELDAYRELPCQPPNTKCGDACIDVQECALECKDGDLQCGPQCVPAGECFECQAPFEPCADGACVPPGTCEFPF